MPVQETVWPLEPHTNAKHQLLTGYIGAWYPILARYSKRIVFLDAFAGPGVYAHGEPGSPRQALEALLDHYFFPQMSSTEFVFVFNELERRRHASLQTVLSQVLAERGGALPPNVKVYVDNKNFVDLADDLLTSLGDKDLAPTFAFLDPFGYKDVPISVIRDLLSFDKCELFIYFDFNSVNRFATARNVDSHFEELFGTDEFTRAPGSGQARKTYLHDLYDRQLKAVCGFQYVQSFEMVNNAGRTGNYMFFCTRNVTGLAKMKDVMWKVAPGGDYRFSDQLAGQQVLFQDDPDTTPLQDELTRHFRGRTVSIEAIEEYTVVHTPFALGHVKKATLKPMQIDGRISSPNQRRKNTFPAGTQVTFH